MNKEVMKPQILNNLEKDWRGKHEKESCQSIICGCYDRSDYSFYQGMEKAYELIYTRRKRK